MTLDAYRDTFRFAARYWLLSPRLFGLMIVARIASNLVDIFVPLASGALVDTLASGGGDPTAALRALAHLIGLVVAFHALRTFVAWALIYVSSRAMEALVRDAFARVQRFSSDWHANSFAGATVRKITRGMWSFDQLGDTLLFGIFPAAVVVIGATTLLVSRWPLLGGVVAIGIAVYLSISVSLSIYWIAPAGQAQQRLDSALGARLADALAGNQVVKDFAAEAREDASFAGLTREWRQAARLNWTRDNTTGFLQSLTLISMQATGGEHSLRPARGDALGNQAGGAPRSRRCLHRPAFRRLWHVGGRARRQTLRRRTPARRHRPRHPRQFADPRAG
jgi:ATP-binding cassette subfamily B protein